MPIHAFLSHAHDYAVNNEEEGFRKLVEVNTFNKYHIFQIEKPKKKGDDWSQPSSVSTRFRVHKNESSGDGLMFRLRAELSTAFSDKVQQGMRVSLMEESAGILVDASSVDNDEGSITLSYDNLVGDKLYTIRYDLYDRQLLVSNSEIVETQFTQTSTTCKAPFITQQLLIMDNRLANYRVNQYLATMKDDTAHDLQQFGSRCDLGQMNNTDSFYANFDMEAAVECQQANYHYKSGKTSQKGQLTKLYETNFQVMGHNISQPIDKQAIRPPILYWFQMIVGLNFMASPGLKIFISRNDHQFNDSNPYSCLFDKSCALAQMSEKNVLKTEFILTSGKYKITFFDSVISADESSLLLQSIRDIQKPLSIKVQALSLIQNEERVNCPYMFMDESFIQNKFIDGMNGQRFYFSDKLIMNVFNLTQHFEIIPEIDSVLKVRVKESFGVNMDMTLKQGGSQVARSSQIGITEIMSYANLKKGEKYRVDLSFANSLIQMASFFTCPHFNLEVSLISLKEAETLAAMHPGLSESENFKEDEALSKIFNDIDNLRSTSSSFFSNSESEQSLVFANHSVIFKSNIEQQEYQVLKQKQFRVGPSKMQMFAEIFYEPYLPYDLELAIFSKDVDNVRAHINKDNIKLRKDITNRGAKSILIELEPGQYEIQIIYQASTLERKLMPQSVQFQLSIIAAPKIDKQQILPSSLNYFGLLGPEGRDFGQMIYFCQDCVMENNQYQIIEFSITTDQDPDVVTTNFDAIISSPDNSLDVRLELAPNQTVVDNSKKTYKQAFKSDQQKGKAVGSRMIRDRGSKSLEKEEIVSAQALASRTKYRVVITVKNTEQDNDKAYRFNLRIEVQERTKIVKKRDQDLLPQSIDEIARYKLKNEGLKESDFLMASSQTLKFVDANKLHPFIRKSNKVYHASLKKSDESSLDNDFNGLIHALKFEIVDEEAMFYGAVFDYTGQAGLGLTIIKDDNNSEENEEDFEIVSIPSKYFSYIYPVALPRGTYYLGIFPQTKLAYEDAEVVKFGLDVLIEKESTDRGFSTEILESAMQFCGIPTNPKTLNWPQYLHPLSGNKVQTLLKLRSSDFLTGDSIDFTISGSANSVTMVQVYVEFSKDTKMEVSLLKGQNTVNFKATQDDLNDDQDNFLKTKCLKRVNVVQLREIHYGKGTMRISFKGLEEESGILNAQERCDFMTVGINIYPINTEISQAALSDQCQTTTMVGNTLEFGQDISGKLSYSLNKNFFDSTYITTTSTYMGTAPYLFYFQALYDTTLEGPISISLYKYEKDTLAFDEVQIFQIQDSLSQVVAKLEDEGTYVLAIQSLSSSKNKFNLDPKIPKKDSNMQIFIDPCIKVRYTYAINSLSDTNYFSKLNSDQKKDLLEILPQVNECEFQETPKSFPISESGYDMTYKLMFKQKAEDVIDLIVEEPNSVLFKALFYSHSNPKNNLNAYLYKNQSAMEPPFKANASISKALMSFDDKFINSILSPQMKAFKLKIVYDSIDQDDSCPSYMMRASQKPIQLIVEENLKCSGLGMPPNRITVDKNLFTSDQSYQVSFDFLDSLQTPNKPTEDVTVDIEIVVPDKTKEYYFDIETRNDFLTAEMQTTLFLANRRDNNLISLEDSQLISHSDSRIEPNQIVNSKSSQAIKRIKVDNIKDLLSEGQSLSDTYILRITFSKFMTRLGRHLKQQLGLNLNSPLCFSFDLSIRVTKPIFEEDDYESNIDSAENEVVRIDWDYPSLFQSNNSQKDLFDPSLKLTAYMEFKESLKDKLSELKSLNYIYLSSLNDSSQQTYYPQSVKLSASDKSTIVLVFPHGILKNGQCYQLHYELSPLKVRGDTNDQIRGRYICTTKCEDCNLKGAQGCDESRGVCKCHKPYSGEKCTECQKGFSFDPETQECLPLSKCKIDGGLIDCNGHGACYEDEVTGQAKCRCDSGFQDDGLDMCGRCIDPMFTFPKCQQRYWMLLHSDYNCDDLKSQMPSYLYKSEKEKQEKVYQNEEGSLFWQHMYRLDDAQSTQRGKALKMKKSFSSTHFFKVPKGNGLFRMFYDTHNSGVEVRVKVLNDKQTIIYQSDDEEQMTANAIFLMLEEPERTGEPFRIVIEYTLLEESSTEILQQCPLIEVLVLVQPFDKMQKFLRCTQDQQANSKLPKRTDWSFSYDSHFANQNFTVSSMDVFSQQSKQFLNSNDDENFHILKYRLQVESSAKGHALSILSTYNFESVFLKMTLSDVKTQNLVAREKLSYIEDVQQEQGSEYGNLDNKDMISFIELADVQPGQYELLIFVEKAMFLPRNGINTCLDFDLSIEHVAVRDDSNRYEVISVIPQEIKQHTDMHSAKIEVRFNKEISLGDLLPGGDYSSDLQRLCYLEQTDDETSKQPLSARKAILTGKDAVEFFFNFESYTIPKSLQKRCFTLKCAVVQKTFGDPTDSTNAYIGEIQLKNSYCISHNETTKAVKCNPNAMARVVNDRCECLSPYTGTLCEQCESSYKASLDTNFHTVCTVDMSKCSSEFCNNHGQCIQQSNSPQDFKCKCTELFAGKFCEKCKNSSYAYPDCDSEQISGDIYSPAYMNRRKYNTAGYETMSETKSEQQCLHRNYPQDLDRVEFMGFLPQSGDFHIADFYTVNHDQDNYIQFTPKKEGSFKIFVQEPESEDMQINDEGVDLEIAVYLQNDKKILSSSVNHYLDLSQHHEERNGSFFDGKLDFAVLQFTVTKELINKTLIVMFRALNYTDPIEQDISADVCTSVYLELQYSSGNPSIISKEFKQIKGTGSTIKVDSDSPFKMPPNEVFTAQGSMPHFFYSQDFQFGDETLLAEQDYELHVSIFQKFTDSALVDFMVEMLDEPTQASSAPYCNSMCLTGGQKAYNEFHNIVELPAKSLIRLWLYKHGSSASTDDSSHINDFGKFQIQVEANRVNVKQQVVMSLSEIRCAELDLPLSLNTDRYLGSGSTQKSFHYLERFRVDNIKNNSAHQIYFSLKEPSMVRVVAQQHKHMEFDLELRQIISPQQTKKLIDSGAKGFEDSIFAQLDKGQYTIKLLFLSEAFFLRQPCQSIQMELAITPLANLQSNSNVKNTPIDFKSLITQAVPTSVSVPSAIKSFSLSNQTQIQSYKSYVELFVQRFTLPRVNNVGLAITIESDFLTNDVNFALTQVNNNRIYSHERVQNGKRLVLETIPGGEMELLIYAHQSLSNMQTPISTFDVQYTVNVHFNYWSDVNDFKKHYLMLEIDKASTKAPLQTLDTAEFSCRQEFEVMPSSLKSGVIDISKQFWIPMTPKYEHKITFTPTYPLLRVIVDKSNTEIKLMRQKDNKQVAQSQSIHAGDQQVLHVTDLEPGTTYYLSFEFGLSENLEEFEKQNCQNFRMLIQSFPTMLKYDAQLAVSNEIQLKATAESLEFVVALNKPIPLKLQEGISTVWIQVEYTDSFYLPSLTVTRNQSLSILREITPQEIDVSIKNVVNYRFSGLKTSDTLTFSAPTTSFVNLIINSKMATDHRLNNQHSKIYLSNEEIKGLNRYIEPLPVSLDTFKYLRNESQYLQVSEYLAMDQDKQENNKISFQIDNDQTLVKFHLESDEIYMTLRDKSRDKVVLKSTSTVLSSILQSGSYEVIFEFSTDTASQKADFLKNSFHISILVAESTYISNSYIKQQGASVDKCSANKNFPLSLNRIGKQKEELIYDYPMMRLSGDILRNNLALDKYAFRINDTSRFYMQLGMHSLVTTSQLRLSDLKDNGISYLGKQEFNINVLDYIVGPGDYSLYIEQPSTQSGESLSTALNGKATDICGLFSLSGRITQLDLQRTNGQSQQQRCPIKQVLPSKLYKGSSDTKDGLENYINQDGTYSRVFLNLLAKKSRETMIAEDQQDTMFIEPPQDGLLSVLFSYKRKATTITAKVKQQVSSYSQEYQWVTPLFSTESDSANGMIEVNLIFPLKKDKQHVLMIFYEGEVVYDESGDKQLCDYYDAIINFDSLDWLSSELQCLNSSSSTVVNLFKNVPSVIKDSDFSSEYKLKNFTSINYPEDFAEYGQPSIGMGDGTKDLIVKPIDIINNGKISIDIDAQIKFDFPYSSFNLHLLSYKAKIGQQQKQIAEETVAVQLEIQLEQGDEYSPVLIRQITSSQIAPQKQYQLLISDDVSWHIMKYIYDQKKTPLCLYSEVSIQLRKQQDPTAILFSQVPLITATFPLMKEGTDFSNAHNLEKDASEVKASLVFSASPYKLGSNKVSNADLSTLVSLRFYHPLTKDLLYAKSPVYINQNTDSQGQVSITFSFSLKDEQQKQTKSQDFNNLLMAVHVDLNNTVDKNGNKFALSKDLQLPKFILEGKSSQNFNKKKQEAAKISGEIDAIKDQAVTKQRGAAEVKCLCVHGTCRQGESLCSRCDSGWKGKLCDTPQSGSMINRKDLSSTKERIRRFDNSKMQRDRNQDEDIHVQKEDYRPQQSSSQMVSQLDNERIIDNRPQIHQYDEQTQDSHEPSFFSILFNYAYNMQVSFILKQIGL